MDKMTIQGAVHQVGATVTFPSGFKKRTLVLKAEPREGAKYDDYLAVDFIKERVADLDKISPGEPLEVDFFVGSKESRLKPGQWFTNCRGVAIRRMMATALDVKLQPPDPPEDAGDGVAEQDEMPF